MAVKTWASIVTLALLVLAPLCASAANAGAKKVDVIKAAEKPVDAGVGESKYWGFFGFNRTRPTIAASSRIVVGGTERWRFGFNYTDWALKTGPFFKNDTLVFMYDPPSNGTFPHSVYLLRDYRSFLACDLRKARMVGNVSQGGGQGFEFVLRGSRPHYFACGERGGIHCGLGTMKFPVFPLPFKRSWFP